MSAVPVPGLSVGARARSTARSESLPLRLVAFVALAWVGAAEWAGLVESPPAGRAAAVVAIAAAGAAALAAAPRVPLPRRVRPFLYAGIVVAAAACALLAAGLPARLLAPARWDSLGEGLDRGLTGAGTTTWPYTGADDWIRLTLALGIPALAVPAMALAFWPARSAAAARGGALVLLLALFAVPATERDAGAPLGRGVLLLALIAAWLWLPRLRGRELLPALAALGAAAVLALPVASALRPHDAWVDYTTWNLFADRTGGHAFDWTHRYGPLDWPRTGETMLEVRSPHQHYWKAETLDRFDGLRWVHSAAGVGADTTAELPLHPDPRWKERIHFTISGLKSDLLVAAGTVYSVQGDHAIAPSADGTVRVLDGPLAKGDSYTVGAYVPAPTAAQMRAAARSYRPELLSYTYFELPGRHSSALTTGPPREGALADAVRTVGASRPGQTPGAVPAQRARIEASPYARTYRLARRLAAGQATSYDVVRNVERYLQHGYSYDERPPLRRIPLNAFLFRDKIGYCQQFSGAMALLLRMDGIPARVASGFAPGVPDPTTKEYRVRDLDAHSWVEVWFTGIGWVPFDPTPTVAPASAQAGADKLPSAATGGHDGGKSGGAARRPDAADAAGGGAPSDSGAGWIAVVALVALPLLALAALWAGALLRGRRVRRAGGDPDLRELRFALDRLGHPVPAGTTLLGLERRLRVTAGAGAAAYVRALRDRRFAGAGRGPRPLDRNALRRGLTEGRGPIVRLRALLVLPPRRQRAAS